MRKKILILLGLFLATLIVVGLMLPTIVEDRVESELAQRLKARGLDASWTDFSSQFGRTFSIEGLKLEDSVRGVTVQAEVVQVAISIDSFMDAEFRLSAIEVEDVLIKVDLKKLRSKADTEPTATSGATSSGLIQRILENPPEIDVRRARLEVQHGNLTLSEMQIEETKVDLSSNDVTLESTAYYKTLAPVPEFLSAPVDVHVSATLELESKDFRFALSHPESGKPLVRLEDRKAGSLTIGTISGDGNLAARTIRADAETIAFRIGDAEVLSGLVAAADVRAMRFERSKDGRIALLLNTPEIVVTPANAARLKPFLKLIGDTQDFLGDDTKDTKKAPAASPVSQSENILRFARLFTRVLHQQDVQMRDLKFSFNVEHDYTPGVYSQITLLERINITTQFGALFAAGETAGGTIRAELDFLPGHAFPRYLFLDVDGLRLGEIPGMPKGRTELPSRGTSGRLDGVVSARLTLLGPALGIGNDPFDAFKGALSFEWKDGEADLVGVSDEPLTRINLKTQLDLVWYPFRQHLLAQNGRFQMGPVRVNYEGEALNFPMDTLVRGNAEMEEIECQRAIRTFPSAMLGPYRNIKIDGKWAPTISVSYPFNRPRGLNFEIEGYEEVCDILSLGVPRADWPDEVKLPGITGTERADAFSDVFWLEKPFVKRITEGLATDESEVYVGPGLPTYVPLSEMPSWVGGAAYLSEEILFYTEHGISLGLLKKALRLNLEKGRFVYGGSTVTQQLIKNLFLTRDKTLSRKLQEALIAWRIAETISKERVLELYLNVIEFGPDIYGIGPAAQYYFQKDARQLTPMESIFLAMLKPSPLYGPRVIQRGSTPAGVWWTKRTEELFRRLVEHKHMTAEHAEREKPYELKWEKGKYQPRAYEIPLFD